MSLFQLGDFTLYSGAASRWKIYCDALTDEDWQALAVMLAERLPPFGVAIGIPRGGIRLAVAMSAHCRKGSQTILLVDDVLTTGSSMEEYRASFSAGVIGAVVFARGECPDWIVPLFQMRS